MKIKEVERFAGFGVVGMTAAVRCFTRPNGTIAPLMPRIGSLVSGTVLTIGGPESMHRVRDRAQD